jgi:hypothetical protein
MDSTSTRIHFFNLRNASKSSNKPTGQKMKKLTIVLDPKGDHKGDLANSRYRNMLMHYVPMLIAQGGQPRVFGEQLRTLSKSTGDTFSLYLEHGFSVLFGPTPTLDESIRMLKGTPYIGAHFENVVWPHWLTGIEERVDVGTFFWGMASDVINALVTGRLADLDFTASEPAIVLRMQKRMLILMPDRTLLAWAPTMEYLYDDNFNFISSDSLAFLQRLRR